jgi:hypothetical protein
LLLLLVCVSHLYVSVNIPLIWRLHVLQLP